MTTLADTRWTDLSEGKGLLLVVPVGATEQHGPHLPMTTDTDIAVALAAALDRERDDVVLAPPVAFGSSGEHQAFPGTLSIGREATELLLVELGRSATETFRRVLFVSTHGGNVEPVNAAVRRLREEGRDVRAWSPGWDGDLHAGHVETSVMLVLAPEAVRTGSVVRGETAPLDEILPQMRREGVIGVSASGVLGDATTATVEDGRTLLRRALTDLAEAVEAWLRATPDAAGGDAGETRVRVSGAVSDAGR
ncbi:mycofactocin biosynthesis peptidyl-dipeptidase MftE [Patulibacter sp. SYSU D01012]|uniref:mycofactocin biosynthesis peptidyl-dipeptidase MftE n=1 Tax=Patulibacter sp. SYSU D01012 TaxID=2817381 RepID=UPI001B30B6EC